MPNWAAWQHVARLLTVEPLARQTFVGFVLLGVFGQLPLFG